MSIKICILTTVHPVIDTRIFHKEAKTLAQAGYDVTLIGQHSRNQIVNGIRIIALPKARNRFRRVFGLTWRAFRLALYENGDIYHLHDPELIPIGVLFCLWGKRVVYDVHEDVPRQVLIKHWIPGWLRPVVAKAAELTELIGTRFFSAIIATTPTIAVRFSQHKTFLVQNFPIVGEVERIEAVPYEQRPSWTVYVGAITDIRGAREMVEAMGILPTYLGARLIIAGKFTPPSLEDELRCLPGWLGVEFVGWQLRAKLADLIGKVRLGLVLFHPAPNHTEALPNKLFEYMVAGLPVIASNFPLWKGIVEGNRCGLTVNPLDPKEIAEAIEYLLTHPEEAMEMGENGRRAVKERYNWEAESKKLLKIYEELSEQ